MPDCIFCKIVKGEIPSKVIWESDDALAFHDVNPVGPTHALVIPKAHVAKTSDMGEGNGQLLGKIFEGIRKTAEIAGIEKSGYRVVINQGDDALQTVHHIHFHVIGGRRMSWPPG